ncbi:MAG: hypothetical protein ACLTW9_30355 [Enterocloster sp.]
MDKAKNISLKKLLTGSLGTVLGLVILVVVFTALSNIFLTPSNIRNILIQSGTNAITAAGTTMSSFPGNIGLFRGRVPGIVLLCGRYPCGGNRQCGTGRGGLCCQTGIPLGLFNGSLAAYLAAFIDAFTMWFREWPSVYGGQQWWGCPRMTACWEVCLYTKYCLLGHCLYYNGPAKTTQGAGLRGGDNSESARLSGINVKRVTLAALCCLDSVRRSAAS